MKFIYALFVSIAFICLPQTASAQDDTARAAWQVTRFDVTANISSTPAERALNARATLVARNVGNGAGRTFTVRLNPAVEVKSTTVSDATARFTSRSEARTKLQQVTVNLPSAIEPGGSVTVTVDYRFPLVENSGLAAISPEGSQFLPLSYWYPMPNTPVAPRGVDTAPMRLTVNTTAGESVVSTGKGSGATYEQSLNVQPFFLTGKWDVVEGAGEAKGVSAWVVAGASPDERRRAEELISLASAARSFFAGMFGTTPDSPVRLVAVRRGAGFDMGGTVLLDASVFRRRKTDSTTALLLGESLARLWVGGAIAIEGEGSGALREGLSRYLALQFLEKQFGREAANAERIRIAHLYAPVARRDAPLSKATPLDDSYFETASNKGALVWRLVADRVVGRDAFMSMLKTQFGQARDARVTLASLRSALGERSSEAVRTAMQNLLDQPSNIDLLIGVPQQRGGEWVAALRNTGAFPVEVAVVGISESGERLTTNVALPAQDFGEARFRTAARLARVEVDPEKLFPQTDFSNDVAPRAPSPEESLDETKRAFAQQQYAVAETTARQAFARAPFMQDLRIWLARSLLEQNKLDEAEREFRAALDSALPTPASLAWANIGLGEAALRRNQPAEAAKYFDEAARADADYPSALAARAGRLRAEAAAKNAPVVDESLRAAIAQLDQAIQSGRKAQLDAVIVSGELAGFSRGIVGSQPELWQTRVLRTESHGTNRMAADVFVNTKTLGREMTGTALLVFARNGGGWQLADIQLFEVR